MPLPQPFSFEPPQPPSGEEMVGIVVVSHSWPLARAAVEMTRQMVPAPVPRIEIAAGLDEQTLGTDAVRVKEAIERANGPDGVLVLLDLGSAVLSGELALDLLDDAVRSHVVLSPAPLVEGLIAAAVTAAGGAPLEEVAEEASSDWRPSGHTWAPRRRPSRCRETPQRANVGPSSSATLRACTPVLRRGLWLRYAGSTPPFNSPT